MYERKDAFYKKAKQEGYRSRAAYKLLQLHKTFRLLKRGDRVVDLGAWPGGWVQVAATLVGKTGKVIGVDVVALEPLPLEQVTLLQGDATDPALQQTVLRLLGSRADVVLSDMAPKLSGIRETDEARAVELGRAALRCAQRLLRPEGTLVLKIFMGPAHDALLTEVRALFSLVQTTRPEATRRGSAERYVVARGLKNPV